jgi:hypothetical protein
MLVSLLPDLSIFTILWENDFIKFLFEVFWHLWCNTQNTKPAIGAKQMAANSGRNAVIISSPSPVLSAGPLVELSNWSLDDFVGEGVWTVGIDWGADIVVVECLMAVGSEDVVFVDSGSNTFFSTEAKVVVGLRDGAVIKTVSFGLWGGSCELTKGGNGRLIGNPGYDELNGRLLVAIAPVFLSASNTRTYTSIFA